jgi:hypothetical protein
MLSTINKGLITIYKLITCSYRLRCTFFFWPLRCLFFFDIRILITSLVSSNSSYSLLWVTLSIPSSMWSPLKSLFEFFIDSLLRFFFSDLVVCRHYFSLYQFTYLLIYLLTYLMVLNGGFQNWLLLVPLLRTLQLCQFLVIARHFCFLQKFQLYDLNNISHHFPSIYLSGF